MTVDDRPRHGCYLRPTVLSEEAVRLSNSVRYGMSATLSTSDQATLFESLSSLEAGMVHVNRPGVDASAQLPHLGAKDSRLGAPECSPDTGNFSTELRTVCIRY